MPSLLSFLHFMSHYYCHTINQTCMRTDWRFCWYWALWILYQKPTSLDQPGLARKSQNTMMIHSGVEHLYQYGLILWHIGLEPNSDLGHIGNMLCNNVYIFPRNEQVPLCFWGLKRQLDSWGCRQGSVTDAAF